MWEPSCSRWRRSSPRPRCSPGRAIRRLYRHGRWLTSFVAWLYRTAREVLDGEHLWLEEGIVGLQELAKRGTASEARPVEEVAEPLEAVVGRSTAEIG